jgi:5-(aminomethyl)-3-furanmethanol phosphate kinase
VNARSPILTVVKLGGSYAYSSALSAWLAAIARAAGRVVIVPGGGPFADAVRSAQPKMGFDDAAAHHMALMAMDQFGRALIGLNPCLRPAASVAAIRQALRAGKVPVWSPTRMVTGAKDVPCSWDVTADSLAAWLAHRIGAQRLLLVKHVDPPDNSVSAQDLAAQGIVDPSFVAFLRASGIEASVAGPGQHAQAARALPAGAMVGSRIDLR